MSRSVVSRRDLFSACGAAYLLGGAMQADANPVAATDAVDHLLLGVSDLDAGIAWVERKTGVKAVTGGSHPGVGTRNALLSLGGRQYLEIIAPDPQQKAFNFQIDIRGLTEPRLITWAARTTDIDSVATAARKAGYQVFGPRDGSRVTPGGKRIQWKTLGVLNKFGGHGVEPVPFFIEWAADSVHPSQDSPKGCEVQRLEVEHPDSASVAEMLKSLGIEASVKPSKSAGLTATLRTPKGRVELS